MSESPEPVRYYRAPRSRWRWLRRIAASIFVSLACYYGWVLIEREWDKRQGERDWATVRADVERDDPDWNWEQICAARNRPPEGRNGALLIPRIKKLMPATWGKELAKDEWKTEFEGPPNRRYAPRVIDQIRSELAESTEAVTLARALRDCPFGHREIVLAPNVLDTLLQDTQDTRTVAHLLRWDAVLAIEDGDPKRAVGDLHALLNTSRSIGDEPFLISQFVRIVCRNITIKYTEWLLAQTPDAPDLAALQDALAADAEEPLFLVGVRGDRAAFDRLFENMQAGTASLAQIAGTKKPNLWEQLGWWHYRAYLPGDRAYAFGWMSRYVDAARKPVHEQPSLVAAIPNPTKDMRHILSGLLLPAVEKVARAHWTGTAMARCAVVGIACERFRQQHGRWPQSLNELGNGFLNAVPLDPYDGNPLRYEKTDTGVAVYSVGKRNANPFVVPAQDSTGLPEGIEIGFRLWNPDQRRLPPGAEHGPMP